MPEPPQLRHRLRPEPEHVPQPTSPSDQRLQRHSSRPVPLHVDQRGRAFHLDAAGSPSPVVRFAIATPASIPSPADAITMGETIFAEKTIQESPFSWCPNCRCLLLPCRVHLPGAGKEWKKRFGWVCQCVARGGVAIC